jgi:hypothetical protein
MTTEAIYCRSYHYKVTVKNISVEVQLKIDEASVDTIKVVPRYVNWFR